MPTSTATSGARRSSSARPPRRSMRPSLIPNEPVTVVLSTGGWVRSAKGHDVEAGRTVLQERRRVPGARPRTEPAAGGVHRQHRAHLYAAGAFAALGARGYGEPLSGRLDPPDGAKFAGVMIGEPEDLWLLASDAGYGFTARLKDLISDRRAGKTVLNVPENAHVLAPAPVPRPDSLVAVVEQRRQAARLPGRGGAGDAARQGQQALRHPGEEGRGAQRADDRGRRRAAEGEPGAVRRRAAARRSNGATCRTISASVRSAARC